MAGDDWPFDDPVHLGVITVRRVLEEGRPILHVSHDVSDGSWQFLTGDDVDVDEAKLVGLRKIVELDPSLVELADLPLGWEAERSAPGAPWERSPCHPIEEN